MFTDIIFHHRCQPKFAILQHGISFYLFIYLFIGVMFRYSTPWIERSWSDLTQKIKSQLVLKH